MKTPATAPASRPAFDINAPVIAPDPGKVVTRTLRLYQVDATPAATGPAATPATPPSWKAVWDNQSPAWTFEPLASLIEHVTKEIYTVSPTPPAPKPSAMPPGFPGT